MAAGELQQVTVTASGQTGTITLAGMGVHLQSPTAAPAVPGTVALTVPARLLTPSGALSLEAS